LKPTGESSLIKRQLLSMDPVVYPSYKYEWGRAMGMDGSPPVPSLRVAMVGHFSLAFQPMPKVGWGAQAIEIDPISLWNPNQMAYVEPPY